MKLNNKGFAITSIIYGILILFSLVMSTLLAMLVTRSNRNEKLAKTTEVIDEIYSYSLNEEMSNPYTTRYKGMYQLEVTDNSKISNCSIYLDKNVEVTYDASGFKVNSTNITPKCNTTPEYNKIKTIMITKAYSANNVNLDKSGANPPVLANRLIPIRHDTSTTWKVADSGNTNTSNQWYDYNNKIWANAATITNITQATNLSGSSTYNGKYIGTPTYDKNSNYIELDGETDYIDTGYSPTVKPDSYSNIQETYAIKFLLTKDDYDDTKNVFYSLVGNYDTYDATDSFRTGLLIRHLVDEELQLCHRIKIDASDTNYRMNCRNIVVGKVYWVVATKNDNQMVMSITEESDIATKDGFPTTTISGPSGKHLIGATDVNNDIKYLAPVKIYDVYYFNESIASGEVKNKRQDYEKNGYIDLTSKPVYHYNFSSKLPVGMSIEESAFDTMYTWIPRFKYQTWTNGVPTTINLEFEKKKESTGVTEPVVGQYYTHPAFKDSTNKDIPGFWIGKFPVSKDVDGYIDIKPGVNILTDSRTDLNEKIKNMVDDETNKYGFDPELIEARMVTNLEWAAMEYLTYSNYGNLSFTINESGKTLNGNISDMSSYSTTNNWSGVYSIWSDAGEIVAASNEALNYFTKFDKYEGSSIRGDGTDEFGQSDFNFKFFSRGIGSNFYNYRGSESDHNSTTRVVLNVK